MAELDLCIKKLLKDRAKFADIFNAEIFGGKQVLKAEELIPLSGESGIVMIDRNGMKRTIQRKRDIAMMAKTGACFILAATEGQHSIHYGMPVRDMTYDALDYTEQLQELERKHIENGDKLQGAEFLSGITKEDRLIPVITLNLYYGAEPWDGPFSLYDMMGFDDSFDGYEELRKFLPDYHLNIIDMRRTENLKNYHTSLQHIFTMVKYNSEKEKFYRYAKSHRQELRSLDNDSLTTLMVLLGEQKRLTEILKEEKRKERIDMCKAIDDLIADGKAEGEQRAEERMTKLFQILSKNSRHDLLLKATQDENFRKQLYTEYHLI